MNRSNLPATSASLLAEWAQYLQRRSMFLLMRYDRRLFQEQFRLFYSQSALPTLPLLQQYDQYLTILLHKDDFFDILERISRQFRAQNGQHVSQEEAPTRGEIDWERTSARLLNEAPDQPPFLFDTTQHRHTLLVPENVFVVAVLLRYFQSIQDLLKKDLSNETLNNSERQQLVTMEEALEQRLMVSYTQELREAAASADIEQLTEQVRRLLPPGNSPYRELLEWWEQLSALHIGQESGRNQITLSSKQGNQRNAAWLYELWIVLELIDLLAERRCITPDSLQIATDQIQIHFIWNEKRFLFTYNRRLDKSAATMPGWQNVTAIPPCYTLKRETLLKEEVQEMPVWSESGIICDVSYEVAGASGGQSVATALRTLLGEMRLYGASHGVIFTPLVPDPPTGEAYAYVQRDETVYTAGMSYNLSNPTMRLCKLLPNKERHTLVGRFQALLNELTSQETLPERPEPVCCGILLDQGTVNASGSPFPSYNVLCPKPHLGEGVFDLVNREKHCLKDPRFCHVIGKTFFPPHITRANTIKNLEDLKERISELRTYGAEAMKQASIIKDETKSEQLRKEVLHNVGSMIEQHVQARGNVASQEKYFRDGVFGLYWKQNPRSLTEETRNILLSGEFVWDEYQETELKDWAAPAIQYCRALEREFKRRLYYPRASAYTIDNRNWTLGTPGNIYKYRNGKRDDGRNWDILLSLATKSRASVTEFESLLQKVHRENIAGYRNDLAHGQPIDRRKAQIIRDIIIGSKESQGVLCWLAEHIDP